MNLKHLILLAGVVVSSIAVKAGAQYGGVQERPVDFQNAFVLHSRAPAAPVEVVVDGRFPNGCYHWGRAEVKHVDSFDHEVKATALYRQGICTMAVIPFTEKIDLGVLSPGHHKIYIASGNGKVILREIDL